MRARAAKWSAALAVSALVHTAAAFALWQAPDEVRIDGGGQVEIAMLGNSFADAIRAGDAFDAIEAVAEAKATERLATAHVELERTVAAPAERVASVRPHTVAASTTERSKTLPAAAPDIAQQEDRPAAETAPSVISAAIAPISETMTASVPAAAVPVMATPPEAEKPVRSNEAEKAQPVSETTRSERVTTHAQAAKPEVLTVASVSTETTHLTAEERFQANDVPVPTPRPDYTPPKEKAKTPPREQVRQTARVTSEKPKPQRKSTSGSGGRSNADAKRGSADGTVNARAASSGKQRNSDKAGNAAISNYPGKVVSKLRRSLRYPSAAKSKRLRGEVRVAFTVTGSGGVTGIRIVRSSGHDVLDRAAIATVQRAAPFPRIPAGAGRKQWAFTVPLAFMR